MVKMGRSPGAFGIVTGLALFIILCDLAAFALLLGGASALQHKSATIAPLLTSMSTALTFGDLAPQVSPADFISYEWFKAVFQVLTLLFCAGCLLTGQLHRTRLAQVALLAVLATLWCDASNTFYNLHRYVDAAEAVTGSYIAKSVRVYMSGCFLSALFNFALIILLGCTAEAPATPADTTYATTTTSKGNPTYANGNENVGANSAV